MKKNENDGQIGQKPHEPHHLPSRPPPTPREMNHEPVARFGRSLGLLSFALILNLNPYINFNFNLLLSRHLLYLSCQVLLCFWISHHLLHPLLCPFPPHRSSPGPTTAESPAPSPAQKHTSPSRLQKKYLGAAAAHIISSTGLYTEDYHDAGANSVSSVDLISSPFLLPYTFTLATLNHPHRITHHKQIE
ncbi:hypothetical protein BGX38DRAFT_789451 [Terfezia claveryi]|nr:hypothetical protein BGX38DRAFT_789451 [Terfezia claveryi]